MHITCYAERSTCHLIMLHVIRYVMSGHRTDLDDALTLALAFWYAIAHAGAKLGMTSASSSTDGGFVGSVAGNSPGIGNWVGVGNGLNA
jgi:hypothetical protein